MNKFRKYLAAALCAISGVASTTQAGYFRIEASRDGNKYTLSARDVGEDRGPDVTMRRGDNNMINRIVKYVEYNNLDKESNIFSNDFGGQNGTDFIKKPQVEYKTNRDFSEEIGQDMVPFAGEGDLAQLFVWLFSQGRKKEIKEEHNKFKVGVYKGYECLFVNYIKKLDEGIRRVVGKLAENLDDNHCFTFGKENAKVKKDLIGKFAKKRDENNEPVYLINRGDVLSDENPVNFENAEHFIYDAYKKKQFIKNDEDRNLLFETSFEPMMRATPPEDEDVEI